MHVDSQTTFKKTLEIYELLDKLKSQAEREEDSKSDHNLKSTLPDSKEQLAKVHSELEAKERSILAGLEKALMESDSEIEDEVVPGQRKGMEFQTEDDNQGQEIDPIPVSSEDSQVSMVQDESKVVTPMKTEGESEEEEEDALWTDFVYEEEGKDVEPKKLGAEQSKEIASKSEGIKEKVSVSSQEFQTEDDNQGQEIDPIPVSSEDSQVSMVQDESKVVTPMKTEGESEEEEEDALWTDFVYEEEGKDVEPKKLGAEQSKEIASKSEGIKEKVSVSSQGPVVGGFKEIQRLFCMVL
ncbi:ribosome biogenesis protein BOP1 homolog [Camellia sinensis]|uniref:ribosome biogenesis protein BOP1 homolog n=1 Tax=Camellia sinensis TaxID=4442 RepID=UPI0010357071|nr:ribosome biogenesis protein BOP1 homolog [Camellia sinensis]